jgi:hypothetical protein
MTSIKFGFDMGSVRLNSSQPLVAFIDRGTIKTDGSQNMVTFIKEGDGWRIGPLIHRDDEEFVFDDFSGFQEGRLAAKEG